jgi:signal transduction histidine kinase
MIAGVGSVTIALCLSAVGLLVLFERHVERRVEAELQIHLDQLLAGLERDSEGELVVARPPADPRFDQPLSSLHWQIVVESDGTILRSRSLWDDVLSLPAKPMIGGTVHQHHLAGPSGSTLLALERDLALPAWLGGSEIRAVVAYDSGDLRAATRAFASDLVPFLALIGALLIAAAWTQVTVGLRPLSTIRDRLAAIRSGASRRLGEAFPDEVRPLAAEIDALLSARELQIEKAKARATDLAHGLKTPLQVLAGDIARLEAKGEIATAQNIAEVAAAMSRNVERELARARIADGLANGRADVGNVVSRVVAVVRRTPDGARLDWAVELPPNLQARIDPDDLAEALGNLVENAARHANRTVEITGHDRAGTAVIAIRDDGPGIPEDQLDDALKRGGRLDPSDSGTGLGLAIVSDIAAAWSATLNLKNTGRGLLAELRFCSVDQEGALKNSEADRGSADRSRRDQSVTDLLEQEASHSKIHRGRPRTDPARQDYRMVSSRCRSGKP